MQNRIEFMKAQQTLGSVLAHNTGTTGSLDGRTYLVGFLA